MASERQRTKGSISTRQTDDPELDEAIAHSVEKQLQIARENNRHKEALQSQDLGRIGKFLGSTSQAALNVAALVALAFTAAAILAAIALVIHPSSSGVLEKPVALFVGIVATTLAYIFGARSTKIK